MTWVRILRIALLAVVAVTAAFHVGAANWELLAGDVLVAGVILMLWRGRV